MKWKQAYATGVEVLDQQHRLLFRMLEDYATALNEGQGQSTYSNLLHFLGGYVRGHFRMEEECMERHRCPAAQCNREAHARFTEVYRGFQARHEAHGFRAADARELVDTLESWLDRHIGGIDAQLRDWVTPQPSPADRTHLPAED